MLIILWVVCAPDFNGLKAQPDSLAPIFPDTSAGTLPALVDSSGDTLNNIDTTITEQGSSSALNAKVEYKAQDSMRFDLSRQKVYLFGKGEVYYEDIVLKADYIEMDFTKNEVFARGVPDSTGKIQGTPYFEDGGESFESSELRYNFKSQKGLIMQARTKQSDGFIEGTKVKKQSDDVLYIENGEFCPCEDPDAGTYLRSKKLKIIKDDKIVTGPAYLAVEDIPTPLAIPFGILPNQDGRASGILIPAPGRSPTQGFSLSEGGYYWAASDHVDLTLKGDIYSRGSWATYILSNYKKRYKFNGNVDFQYSRFYDGLPSLQSTTESRNFFLKWNHTQDPKARPNSRFSASLNFGSGNSFRQNLNSSDQNYLTNTFKSNVNYTKKFPNKPFNLTLNASHNQTLRDSVTEIGITLPQVAFTMQRVQPFKRKEQVGKRKWYEDIGISYTGNFINSFNTTEAALRRGIVFDPENPYPQNQSFNLANSQNGIEHSIPVNTNIKVLKRYTITPKITYNEKWYSKRLNYAWDSTNNQVVTDTSRGFHRFGSGSFRTNVSTNIYGMYTFRGERLKAIRHHMTPNVSFNYSPNTFKDVIVHQSDSLGNTAEKTGYENFTFRGPNLRETGSIDFQLRNNVEMKVKSKGDTLDDFKKIKLLDQLNFLTSYDLFKDSLNWRPINVTSNISLLQFLTLRLTSTFDPYGLSFAGTQRVEKSYYDQTGKLARLTNASAGLTLRLDNKLFENKDGKNDKKQGRPWSMNINYNYNLSRPTTGYSITQSVGFNGRIDLTQKWKVSGNTNYDLKAGEFSYTSVQIHRDLNCWELSFDFIPFGGRKSYTFRLNIKPALLKDLKLERTRDWFDFNEGQQESFQ